MSHHPKAASGDFHQAEGWRLSLGLMILTVVLIGFGPGAATASAADPQVFSATASNPEYTTVEVSGELEPAGANCVKAAFQVSTDQVNWEPSNIIDPGEGNLTRIFCNETGPQTFSGTITNLVPETTYYVRLATFVGPNLGEMTSQMETANPITTIGPIDPPHVISIEDVTSPGATLTQVSGVVERPAPGIPDPGFDLKCRFEYIPNEQFLANEGNGEPGFAGATEIPCTPNPVGASDPPTVTAQLESLAPGTEYHLRLTVSNAGGTDSMVASTFTTKSVAPPVVSNLQISELTGSSVKLAGDVDPLVADDDPGFTVHWRFECEPSCVELTNGSGAFSADGNSHSISTNARIDANTDYTFRLVAENSGGSANAQATGHSDPLPPAVESVHAFAYGDGTEARIAAKINPRNTSTEYWFEYGPGPGGETPIYPFKGPVSAAGSNNLQAFHVEDISGLSPASAYHFRVVAKNANGEEEEGEDVDFKTLPAPQPIEGNCPNEKLRSETGSEALPNCRAYEVATPADMAGGDVYAGLGVAPGGNYLGYVSLLAFGDADSNAIYNSFRAERTANGWFSHAMQPRFVLQGGGNPAQISPVGFSEDFSNAVGTTRGGVLSEPKAQNIFLTRYPEGTTWVTKPTVPEVPFHNKCLTGYSADASHIIFTSSQPFVAGSTRGHVWEWVNGEVRQVDLLPGGESAFVGYSAGAGGEPLACLGAFRGRIPGIPSISNDGERVFFVAESPDQTHRLYVREHGNETREIGPGQKFAGASTDGSVAFFESADQLTGDATPDGGLYAYDLQDDQLSFVSVGATNAAGARFVSSTAVPSGDGSRVYFIARSVLQEGRGEEGARNLYVWHRGTVRYIATLSADDVNQAVTADGGQYYFQSFNRLTAYDNAGQSEIYRYNAETQELMCVSCGLDTGPADADASMIPHPPGGQGSDITNYGTLRLIDSSGGKLVFQTREGLVPGDVNGIADVYLYDEGRLSLISVGTSEYDSDLIGITSDGDEVSFTTRDSLVGQDSDGGGIDVYVARVNGGFPAPAARNPCESSDACQRTPSTPPIYTPPASTAPGRGNPKPTPRKPHCKKQKKAKKPGRKCGSKGNGTKKKNHRQASNNGRTK